MPCSMPTVCFSWVNSGKFDRLCLRATFLSKFANEWRAKHSEVGFRGEVSRCPKRRGSTDKFGRHSVQAQAVEHNASDNRGTNSE